MEESKQEEEEEGGVEDGKILQKSDSVALIMPAGFQSL